MTKITKGYGFPDPYDALSDDDFEREVINALEQGTVKITLRVPRRLIERAKLLAGERGVPYEALIEALLDRGVTRLEGSPQPKRPHAP